MKKLAAILFIALFVLESFPGFTKADSTTKTAGLICIINFAEDGSRPTGNGTGEFKPVVGSSYIDILIVGDGSAILIRI
jgi:hypothetical protein